MVTDRIPIANDEKTYNKIFDEVEKFSSYEKYLPKDTMRLRLLTEEAIGMVKGITEEIKADIWFEGDEEVCKIHIAGKTDMSRSKYDELMSMSFSGNNTLTKGLAGKIGEVIQLTFMSPGDIGKTALLNYGTLLPDEDLSDSGYAFQTLQCDLWSLQQYRQSLFDEKDADPENSLAWDELEKSIVGNLADDVQIGINRGKIEVTIVRRLENK